MQLQLDDVALFTRIAELGTLSAAARERDVPVSQVTRALVRLEASAKVRLLHRSTHGLSLTDEGDTFLAYARRLLDTTAELSSELTGKLSGPSGWVRISVSPLLAQTVIAPSLSTLYARYPELHIDLCADDRMADMARDGIDIAIRTGTPNGDTLVARQIGSNRRALYAAPSYLAQARHTAAPGRPAPAPPDWQQRQPRPESLAAGQRWHRRRDGGERQHPHGQLGGFVDAGGTGSGHCPAQ